MTPNHFADVVLKHGTTSAICDPHELANVIGVAGIEAFLKASVHSKMNLQVMLSSCVPATHFETNGGGALSADSLSTLKSHPHALGLAEIMNVPAVLNSDPEMLKKLEMFQEGPIDGHSPLLRGKELSAYLISGISSCHESSELEEAREKIEKGMSVWIREGSVAKDLHTLLPLLDSMSSLKIGFCSDDRNPLDILEQGHLNYMIREAIRSGIPPEVVFRSASYTVAAHYGLHQPSRKNRAPLGALAPGFLADLVVLGDFRNVDILDVYRKGKSLEFDEFPMSVDAKNFPYALHSVRAHPPDPNELQGPVGQVNVIGVQEGKILTNHLVLPSDHPGVCRFSVLERYGRGTPPMNAYAFGFGENLRGAIASSVGHDSHNLAVIGSETKDMSTALKVLIKSGGGFVVVQDDRALAHLPLPIGGLMSEESPESIIANLRQLREASHSIGCELQEPFLQLAFLCLPVIPALKLTDQGLIDVVRFERISVAV
jgi:adenine deaminase